MNIAKKILVLLHVLYIIELCEPSSLRTPLYNKNDKNENCPCFPKSDKLTPISEFITSPTIETERLVIYMYKDMLSQNIAMFIPNINKQRLIPELNYEAEDDLIYPFTTETVYNIFNASPQKFVIGTLDEHTEFVTPEDAVPITNEFVVNTPVTWITEIVETVEETFKEDIIEIPDNTLLEIEKEPTFDITEIYDNSLVSEISDSGINIEGSIQISPTDMHTLDTEFEIKNFEFPNYKRVVPYNHLNLNLLPDKYKENPGYKQNFQTYENINNWIEQQLINANVNFNAVDIQTLRMLILETLIRNKITITLDGRLIDAWGNILDPSNLVLRLLFLDNTAGFNNKLENFMQALMISLKDPPRLLGVIPLDKTYASQPMKYLLKQPSGLTATYSSNTQTIGCGGDHCSRNGEKKESSLPELAIRFIPVKSPNKSTTKTEPQIFLTSYEAEPSSFDVDTKLQNNGNLQSISKFLKVIPFLGRSQQDDKELREQDNNIEDDLGVRIVGGSAATGSGTPVSNRGRSGAALNIHEP